MQRSYGQFCALAHALDVVGDRWTLLVVRELAFGPKRYTDLLDNLPGVGTSMLAGRLLTLEAHDVVHRRRLAPPAASTVYELTDIGNELIEALMPLVLWGARYTMDRPEPTETFRAEWPLLVMQAIAKPDAGVADVYEFRVDGLVAHVVAEDGRFAVRSGPAPRPDVVLDSDAATFVGLGVGRVDAGDAIADGRLRVSGTPEAVHRLAAAVRVAAASSPVPPRTAEDS